MNAIVSYEPKARPAPLPEEDRLLDSLHELKDLLVRRRSSLLGCVGGCLLLASAYLAVTQPKYTASATIMVDGEHTDVIHQDAAVGDAQILNAMAESQVEVLRSIGLAREAVDRLHLTSDPLFPSSVRSGSREAVVPDVGKDAVEQGGDVRERAAQQFLRMMSVKRIGMTYVLEVDVTAATAKEAAILANGVTTTYLTMQARTRGDTTRQAADWLSQQLEALRQRALSADEAVQSFKAANGIIETDQGSVEQEQAATLNSQLLAATDRTAQAQARVDRLSAVVKENGISDGGVSDVIQDPVLTSLQQHYFEVAQRESEFSARYGRSHAIAIKLREQMADLQGSIHQEVARIAAAAQSDLAIARTSEATIRSQLATLVGQSGTAGAARAKLRSLESSASIYRAVYTSSLQHYAQSTQDSSFPVVAAHIVSEAEPPLAKSKPRKSFVLAGALVLGVAAGVSLALVLEFLDETLMSATQVERELGVVCLARLPRLVQRRGGARRDVTLAKVMTDLPHTRFAKEIRRLRLRILQHLGEDRCGVIGVVASRASDGTSAVAHNLSSALMEGGRSVALVALQSSTIGHSAVPSHREASGQALAVFDVRSGPAGDLLRRLNDLRAMHDVLILDLPPLFDVDGADDIIRALDCVVLVARCGATRSRDLIDLVDGSGLDWPRVGGVVLNCVDREAIDRAA